jgi:hypothetical protein
MQTIIQRHRSWIGQLRQNGQFPLRDCARGSTPQVCETFPA